MNGGVGSICEANSFHFLLFACPEAWSASAGGRSVIMADCHTISRRLARVLFGSF